jgi:hypothetical protein
MMHIVGPVLLTELLIAAHTLAADATVRAPRPARARRAPAPPTLRPSA